MSFPRFYVDHLPTLTNVEKYNIQSKGYQHIVLESIKIIMINRIKLFRPLRMGCPTAAADIHLQTPLQDSCH